MVRGMSSSFYQLLKKFIWPRYREEGPPSHIDSAFFDKQFMNNDGQMKEPVKSILDLIVLGYRPVTTLSILSLLVENQNRPMYGAQLGKEMEKRFELPKGWFTKTRYYDNRVGKLLKILCRLNILEETEITDSLTKRRYVGYYITEDIYLSTREKILNFVQGGTLSLFTPTESSLTLPETKKVKKIMRCTKCQALTTSPKAKYCELCGNSLAIICAKCKRENDQKYDYCLYCGEKLT